MTLDELARVVCVMPAVFVVWAWGSWYVNKSLITRDLVAGYVNMMIGVMFLWSAVTCIGLALGML